MTPHDIRAAREYLGLTQAQLAAVMRKRQATISQWETGKANISSSHALLLHAYLDGYRPPDWPLPTTPPA